MDEPPPSCRNVERWRWAHSLYARHAPNEFSRCRDFYCGVDSPCFSRMVALRVMIQTCEERPQPEPLSEPGMAARCQWFAQEIRLHPICGWLHMAAGFIVCRELPDEAAALSVAEVASTGR